MSSYSGDVQTTLKNLLVDLCEDASVVDDPHRDLFAAGYLDSLTFVELLVALGDTFDVRISPTEVEREQVATLAKLTDFVRSKLNA